MNNNRRFGFAPLALLAGFMLAGCAPSNLQMGLDAERAGNYQAMLTHCRNAAEEPNPDPRALLCMGDAYMRLGDRRSAESTYLTYLERMPNDVDARMKVIDIYMDDGRHLAAQSQIEELLHYDPANYKAFFYLGEIHRLNNVCDAAVDAYHRSLDINPAYSPAIAGLEKVQREVCPPEPAPPPRPRVKKEKVFQGGGKALPEGSW